MRSIPSRLTVGLVLIAAASCTSAEVLPDTEDAGAEAGADAAEKEGGAALQGTMQCGDIPVATDACAECADEHCCAAGEACAANPDCLALRACLAACPMDDAACAESCGDAHPAGSADNAVLSACRMRWCGQTCFGSSDTACGFQLPPAPCQACAQSMCCEVGWVANSQPSFWTYQDCVATCEQASCFQQCEDDNPQGYAFYMSFIGCLGTHCAEDCGVQPAATCGGFYGQACGPCVDGACCDQSLDCLLDAGCQRLRGCVGGCGDDAECLAACQEQAPEAWDSWLAYDACLSQSCGSVCP